MSPDFERLVGRAILDRDFRDKLLSDPDGTVKSAGLNITSAELDQVRAAAKERSTTEQKLEAARGSQW